MTTDFEDKVKALGFESAEEFHRLVSLVDVTSEKKLLAFRRWKQDDGTKAGLLGLPAVGQPCPDCGGRGSGPAILCSTDRCEVGSKSCSTCGGSGRVSEADLARRETGKEALALRLSLDLSLREAARLLGVSPVTLGEIERGRREPPGDFEAWVLLAAAKEPLSRFLFWDHGCDWQPPVKKEELCAAVERWLAERAAKEAGR